MSILVVEDDNEIADLIALYVRRAGHSVHMLSSQEDRVFSRYRSFPRALMLAAAALCASVVPALAQAAAAASDPADTPSIKVGATIFADYTVQEQPKTKASTAIDFRGRSSSSARAFSPRRTSARRCT